LDEQDRQTRAKAQGKESTTASSVPNILRMPDPYLPPPCPQTYTQYKKMDAEEREKWERSMDKEWNSIMENDVLCIVDRNKLPENAVVIPSKWIYKVKSCGRYKSRLVCLGNLMPDEEEDCSSPTPRLSSARLLFSLAAKSDLDIHLCDVNTAFLAAQSQVPVYIKLPPGYEQPGKVGLCLRSLYGTSTAPKAFNTLLHNKMLEWGFEPNHHEACLYTKVQEGVPIHVLCHVDDLAIASTPANVQWFKDTLRTTFMIDDQGLVKRYLGVDITRDEQGYTWSQSRLIAELVHAAGHTVTKNYAKQICPIRKKRLQRHALTQDQRTKYKKPYRNILGVVGYLVTCTRPDCAYAYKTLAQFNDCYTHEHWEALMELVAYLHNTADTHVLRLTKTGGTLLNAYCDADLNNTDKSKSTSGWIVFHGHNPISWCSKTQTSTARSTAESEFISLSSLSQECIYLRMLLQSITGAGVPPVYTNASTDDKKKCDHSTSDCQCHAVDIWCDSQNAIAQAKRPWVADKLRHIKTAWFFFKDYVKRGELNLQYILGKDNCADILTKGFGEGKPGTSNQMWEYFTRHAKTLLGHKHT
jgi:hypothetical protein